VQFIFAYKQCLNDILSFKFMMFYAICYFIFYKIVLLVPHVSGYTFPSSCLSPSHGQQEQRLPPSFAVQRLPCGACGPHSPPSSQEQASAEDRQRPSRRSLPSLFCATISPHRRPGAPSPFARRRRLDPTEVPRATQRSSAPPRAHPYELELHCWRH